MKSTPKLFTKKTEDLVPREMFSQRKHFPNFEKPILERQFWDWRTKTMQFCTWSRFYVNISRLLNTRVLPIILSKIRLMIHQTKCCIRNHAFIQKVTVTSSWQFFFSQSIVIKCVKNTTHFCDYVFNNKTQLCERQCQREMKMHSIHETLINLLIY